MAAIIIVAQACQQNEKLGKLAGGMEYEFITKTEGGQVPENGEFIALNILVKNSNDSVITDSKEMGIPVLLKKDSLWGTTEKFQDCFNLMAKGDSAIFKMPANALFLNQLPPGIDSSSTMIVQAGLANILDEAAYQEMVTEWRNKQRMVQMETHKATVLAMNKDLLESQGKEIDDYLAKNNLTAETTETGIRCVIKEKGEGIAPEVGDQVTVAYTGKLLDGTIFDTSDEEIAKQAGRHTPGRQYAPYPFQLGIGSVILGWHEGIALLNEGDKATLYIPSPFGYGAQGSGEIIKPNSILVFDVELVNVIK